jgi:hypothetical protein
VTRFGGKCCKLLWSGDARGLVMTQRRYLLDTIHRSRSPSIPSTSSPSTPTLCPLGLRAEVGQASWLARPAPCRVGTTTCRLPVCSVGTQAWRTGPGGTADVADCWAMACGFHRGHWRPNRVKLLTRRTDCTQRCGCVRLDSVIKPPLRSIRRSLASWLPTNAPLSESGSGGVSRPRLNRFPELGLQPVIPSTSSHSLLTPVRQVAGRDWPSSWSIFLQPSSSAATRSGCMAIKDVSHTAFNGKPSCQ